MSTKNLKELSEKLKESLIDSLQSEKRSLKRMIARNLANYGISVNCESLWVRVNAIENDLKTLRGER